MRLRLAAMLAGLVLTATCWAQATEYQVKAAFLYKFGGYVEWPADALGGAGAPFTVGVMGAEELAAELSQITSGRSTSGHPISVRSLRPGDPLEGLQVLFVGRDDAAHLPQILDALHGRPVLVVTESDDGLPDGSMINFVLVDDKVRFDIAPASAEHGNLRISSRLLAVARRVVGGQS
ncbi:MAG TPA: YfiR family protein [Burkholderiales bacterium]|nr:YfiR family protein [Burkholderiales bacterium]